MLLSSLSYVCCVLSCTACYAVNEYFISDRWRIYTWLYQWLESHQSRLVLIFWLGSCSQIRSAGGTIQFLFPCFCFPSLQIEAIQKRAIKIIFECTRDMSYPNSLYLTELFSLQHRRQQQARDFFRSLLDPNSCLHSLLPTPRDPNLVTRLRAARWFPALASRTKKYQSFINFGLLKLPINLAPFGKPVVFLLF